MTYKQIQIQDADMRYRAALKRLYRSTWSVQSGERLLYYAAGDRIQRQWGGKCSFWTHNGVRVTESEIEDLVRQIAAEDVSGPVRFSPVTRARTALDRLDTARSDRFYAENDVALCEREWDANGRWTRYYAVQGGRVHATRACRTLRSDTSAVPIAELSGKSVSDAVADFGACLCTVCYPDAPAEWTGLKYTTPKMRDFYARRAQRRAASEAKQVIDPNTGKPLVGVRCQGHPNYWSGRMVRTERTAENMVVAAMADLRRDPDNDLADEWNAYIERALTAIAAKRGLSGTEDLRRECSEKAERKYARELRSNR